MDFGGGDDIRFERKGKAGFVTLTRPKTLNAINHTMIRALAEALDAWRDDPDVDVVAIKAEGRAFSAGGDILDIYNAGLAGNPPVGFFADEYRLNAAIARFPKPYVALIDGIVMGGGVGVSCHGSHRVMTENAQFAMPEVSIGFFPDVGGSYFLPRLGGYFGMYLGLTGNRIRCGDALWSGVATHTIRAEYLDGIVERLAETGDADLALREAFVPAQRETPEGVLEAIARHFSRPSLEETLKSLETAASGDEFAARTLAILRSRSPTGLNVAFRQIMAGRALDMDECMRMEFRILNRMLQGHDFYEGIRAAIIDKDGKPAWRPASFEEIEQSRIDAYFEPLQDGELPL